MLLYFENTIKIVCDKCGISQENSKDYANKIFYSLGWTMNRSAKRYIHKCPDCSEIKMRKRSN